MLDVSAAIMSRRSIRKWDVSVPVDHRKIRKVIEAGRLAPSWANVQPWKFYVIENRQMIEAAARAVGGKAVVKTAPLVVVAYYETEAYAEIGQRNALSGLVNAGSMDLTKPELDELLQNPYRAPHLHGKSYMERIAAEQVSIALAYMTLEATNQGLGSCWVGYADSSLKVVLGVPDEFQIHSLLALGYPMESPEPRPRKGLEEVAVWLA